MGKKEIELRIKTAEVAIEKYISLSPPSVRNDERYKATLERMRVHLASLYMEMESYKHNNENNYGEEKS